ncbi:hypothetical protein LIER_14898 [Lithospermum erythrorhizon]|uniref:Uncharacterized protein n=1 Tax=Lithospermum erythrorhizon TaxID=34254 RepID=A0AAV3Q2D8_LITER
MEKTNGNNQYMELDDFIEIINSNNLEDLSKFCIENTMGDNHEHLQDCDEGAARRNDENDILISLTTKAFSSRKELIEAIQQITFSQGAEGAHSILKQYLQVSTGNFHEVKDKVCLVIENQFHEIKTKIGSEQIRVSRKFEIELFEKLKTRVFEFAMEELYRQYELAISNELPFEYFSAPSTKEPVVHVHKGRPPNLKKRKGSSSTKRNPSGFEIAEINLSQHLH